MESAGTASYSDKKNNNSLAHVQKVRQSTIKLQQTKYLAPAATVCSERSTCPTLEKQQHICDLAKTHNRIQSNPQVTSSLRKLPLQAMVQEQCHQLKFRVHFARLIYDHKFVAGHKYFCIVSATCDNASSYCTAFGSICDKTRKKSCSSPLLAFILFAFRIPKQLIKATVVKLMQAGT